MELLGPLVSFVECVSPHVAKRWEYHREFRKNKDALVEALDKLNRRKTNIEENLDALVVTGVTERGSEVVGWLQRFDEISQKVKDIEKEVRDVKFCSRASLGRKIAETKLQVDGLYEEGMFSEGSLIKRLPRHGDLIQTPDVTKRQTTFQKVVEDIWSCLLDDGITKIGVYGMGGVGKTTAVEHVNNRLVVYKDKFDKVIWVTVSNKSNVKTLQEKLARKLELDISRIDDEESRAEKLHQGFARSKKYVLILDDLWEAKHDTLKKAGIPDPRPLDGCKLLLTTRSLEVCRKVCCDKEIAMNLLSEEEALELFYEKVGRDVSSNPNLEKMVKQVAQECARLPLAITVIAGSLRSKTDPNEWEVALTDLKDSTGKISDDVMRNLRLSYDWLKDEALKESLLYCALFPEDYSIERSLLIDQLIAVGIVKDIKTRQYQVGKGQVLLNELVSLSLLNNSFNDKGALGVKMHDLIRDMAIQIMRETSQRFLVKASEELEFIPGEEYWNEALEKVTLMENKIVEISSSKEPPNCPKLSILLLNSNCFLRGVPDNFFCHMKGLNVLNLSRTAIMCLPESVSELVNLAILLLEGCKNLIFVPSLGNLTNMKRLNLRETRIVEVPEGIEMMVKLTHLDLSHTRVRVIPDGILCKLTNLELLSFISTKKIIVNGDELCNHFRLETFEASLNLSCYNTVVRSLEKRSTGLINMKLLVFPDGEFVSFPFIYDRSPNAVEFRGLELSCENGFQFLLPKNIKRLYMSWCITNRTSLCQLFHLGGDVANLVEIKMEYCEVIEHVFHYSPSIFPLLKKLQLLELVDMPDLRGLICMEISATLPLPVGSFFALKELLIENCPLVKNLHGLSDVSILPNLEQMSIKNCHELEEIFSDTSVPKLRVLVLKSLPKLMKSISFKVDQSPLEIYVDDCPCVKKLFVWSDPSIFLNLKNMVIWSCDELEEIMSVDCVTYYNAPKMEMLSLIALPNLKSIPFKAEFLRDIRVVACPMIEKIALFEKDSSYPQSLAHVVIENRAWPSREYFSSFVFDAIIKPFITEEIPAGEELHKLAESEYYKKLEKLPVDRVREAFSMIDATRLIERL